MKKKLVDKMHGLHYYLHNNIPAEKLDEEIADIADAILDLIRAEMPGEKVVNSNIPVKQCAINMSWNNYRQTFLKIMGE